MAKNQNLKPEAPIKDDIMDDIDRFFLEDLDEIGDITSNAILTTETGDGEVWVKQACVLAGLDEATMVFKRAGTMFSAQFRDGARVKVGTLVATVVGETKDILKAERLALNFLGRMSGIATQTRTLIDLCHKVNPNVRVAATRKTTPGFRKYEKKAVVIGGGEAHRMGLYDAVLIKDNHLKAAGSVELAVDAVRRKLPGMPIEIEVEGEEDALIAAGKNVACIMLDNLDSDAGRLIAEKIREVNPGILIEVSGGITKKNIVRYAGFADRISVGALTHSASNIDFSLEMLKTGST
jgi:nicotinate-nucleotide pyrophosphorylase (carboxylating)